MNVLSILVFLPPSEVTFVDLCEILPHSKLQISSTGWIGGKVSRFNNCANLIRFYLVDAERYGPIGIFLFTNNKIKLSLVALT